MWNFLKLLKSFLSIQQSELSAQDFSIGIGFTLEHPHEINVAGGFPYGLRIHKVYFPIIVKSKFIAIPELAYWDLRFSKVDWIYGGTLGAEYALIENLSCGFEIQLNYYTIKPWRDIGDRKTTTELAIETVFVLAFHF